MANRGYSSQSMMYRAAQRFLERELKGQKCWIVYLGDHDPSGIDMTRDNRDRLALFAEDHGIEVRRIALNMDQVEQYAPPTNPTKVTDSRAAEYIENFGYSSWELDALEPKVIVDLIQEQIEGEVDHRQWEYVAMEQAQARKELRKLGDNWEAVQTFLKTIEL